ncbi:MAG: CDGSH iron-sulfur domain-containing protein [Planctomycetes bacterium]|nr:CDGSH iron-sulfur domain-containing protein [Planctomycetota bacterium]
MARLVRHEKTDPIRIDPATWPRDEQGNLKVLSICACGISQKFPFCDGSHKGCRAESPGHVYRYDPVTKAVLDSTQEG